MEEYETQRFVIDPSCEGVRVDKTLGTLSEDLSRARIQALIAEGRVRINGMPCDSASMKTRAGDVVELDIPPPVSAVPQPENIPLAILYEDADLLVIDKPAGMVVHPGAGNYEGTLVNALLYHCGESLSGIGGVLRPGIVHRLDKDTSGLMVVAKHDKAHHGLAAQLEDRSLSRLYHALVLKIPVPLKGRVEAPIARDPRNRQKMAVARRGGRAAVTQYHVLESFGEACALTACRLETGRTHQIRVHMAHIGHPLIGDPVYGPQPTAVTAALKKSGFSEAVVEACLSFPRQALHARELAFVHPVTGEAHRYESALPEDISKLLNLLRK